VFPQSFYGYPGGCCMSFFVHFDDLYRSQLASILPSYVWAKRDIVWKARIYIPRRVVSSTIQVPWDSAVNFAFPDWRWRTFLQLAFFIFVTLSSESTSAIFSCACSLMVSHSIIETDLGEASLQAYSWVESNFMSTRNELSHATSHLTWI
jgi:hypothetical protein